jgi:hypothetical protein
MKNQVKKNLSCTAQRRMIAEMIDAGFKLAEKLGPHSLTKGCNCIACVNKRKHILDASGKEWRFKL